MSSLWRLVYSFERGSLAFVEAVLALLLLLLLVVVVVVLIPSSVGEVTEDDDCDILMAKR